MKKILGFNEFSSLGYLEDVIISIDPQAIELLQEGKWIKGRFDRNIRIDQPTHGAGNIHAHILARNGAQIGVVNIDGTGSHGSRFRIHAQDADALRSRGFKINEFNIVEWIGLGCQPGLLLG